MTVYYVVVSLRTQSLGIKYQCSVENLWASNTDCLLRCCFFAYTVFGYQCNVHNLRAPNNDRQLRVFLHAPYTVFGASSTNVTYIISGHQTMTVDYVFFLHRTQSLGHQAAT